MLSAIKISGELTVDPAQRDLEIDMGLDSPGSLQLEKTRKLLGAIVSQARLDGMSALRIQVASEHNEVSMSYFGPASDGSVMWWQMTAPPVEVYPSIIQCVMALAELEPGLPLRGRVRAKLKRKPFEVLLEVPALAEVILKWKPVSGK